MRVVVCAAHLYEVGDGLVICGARHFDKVMRAQIDALGGREKLGKEIQGFIDQYGEFMSREEAKLVAERAGQLNTRRPKTGPEHKLFSEDLY